MNFIACILELVAAGVLPRPVIVNRAGVVTWPHLDLSAHAQPTGRVLVVTLEGAIERATLDEGLTLLRRLIGTKPAAIEES